MLKWLSKNNVVATFSTLSILVMLERIFLDFRYVALEMEAPLDIMPFTLPYMAFTFLVLGGWLWALLASVKGCRGALIALIVFNAFNLFFSVITMITLCPLPCGTAAPIGDMLIIAGLVISIAAIISASVSWWSKRARAMAKRSA
jgi:hypothetical protein